jgi:hypothetical protein
LPSITKNEDQNESYQESYSNEKKDFTSDEENLTSDNLIRNISQNSLIDLVKEGRDFISLDVLIQMEYCSG